MQTLQTLVATLHPGQAVQATACPDRPDRPGDAGRPGLTCVTLARPKRSPKRSPGDALLPVLPAFPAVLVLLATLLAVLLLAARPVQAAQAAGQAVGDSVQDFVAPGYPLYGTDQTYTGFGTMPNAPTLPGTFTLSAGGTAAAGSMEEDREGAALRERLMHMQEKSAKEQARERAQHIRDESLRQAAGTIAFQQAVRHHYARLGALCEQRAHDFDRIFNFRQLMLEGRVLPPVISWIGPAMRLESADAATSVEAAWRIEAPARIVSRAPDWRDYLLTDFAAFEAAPGSVPENSHEQAIWQEGVALGWDEGREQAKELFELNMARLVTDYRGMLHFRMLARQGMVSMPGLAEGHLGLRVGARTLHVNETVFRITQPAAFLPEEAWQENRRP